MHFMLCNTEMGTRKYHSEKVPHRVRDDIEHGKAYLINCQCTLKM